VLELLGQGLDIVTGEEGDEIGGLGRVTPDEVNRLPSLEDAGHFIAGHQNRDLPLGTRHPLGQLPLGMGVGAVHFI
jgi:hypothetical protein